MLKAWEVEPFGVAYMGCHEIAEYLREVSPNNSLVSAHCVRNTLFHHMGIQTKDPVVVGRF